MDKLIVEYTPVTLLEDQCPEVIQFSPIAVTWKAYDQAAALEATAILLAKGYKAQHYPVHHAIRNEWHVRASFH